MPKAGIQFQKKDGWLTPKEVVDFFGPFDYDPATTKEQAECLGIPDYDTVETDGLTSNWHNYSRIFCNPPFTRKFEFLKKTLKPTTPELEELLKEMKTKYKKLIEEKKKSLYN